MQDFFEKKFAKSSVGLRSKFEARPSLLQYPLHQRFRLPLDRRCFADLINYRNCAAGICTGKFGEGVGLLGFEVLGFWVMGHGCSGVQVVSGRRLGERRRCYRMADAPLNLATVRTPVHLYT